MASTIGRVIVPRQAAVLLGLLVVLLFVGLGATALTDRDEGANAEAAREMREQASWVSPTLNYAPRFAKPPLTYWLMAGGYATLGVGETAARLPSAVAIAALVLLQYAFARWAFDPSTAFRSALILLLTGLVVALGRLALTDAMLVLWTTAAGFAFFRAHHGPPPRRRWYAAMYGALALGVLTKGPVGALVPAIVIALYLTVAGGWRRVGREAGLPWGLALFLLVAGPWFAAMWWLHGGTFVARAQGETLGRVFRTVTGPGGTVLFYVPVVLVGLFPWSALLPGALVDVLRGARRRVTEGRAAAAGVFTAIWVVAVLVLFSLFQSRLPHYVAPLFPAAALLLAARWPARVPAMARVLLAALGLLCGGALVAATVLGPIMARLLTPAYPAAREAALPGSLMTLGLLALATGAAALLRDGPRLFAALATITALLLASGVHLAWPTFDARFVAPAGQLARTAGAAARPCDDVVAIEPYRPSLAWYARRPLHFVGIRDASRLAEIAARPGRLFVLTPRGRLGDLPAAVGALPTLETRGGYVLLASAPVGPCPGNPPPPRVSTISQ
jgi:4-amino-4-deoxy-L-arabinose transferase-like glycosyltransferase